MRLRDYQQKAIDLTSEWIGSNLGNNLCLKMATGSGKSHIVANLCKHLLQAQPELNILMLTHQKELIEQNYEKLRQHWPTAPVGIYSASVGRKDIGDQITFAGIQSIRSKSDILGHIDFIIVDECHMISHKEEGSYRSLIDELKELNPLLSIIGLTATPYRLGHGLITEGTALFDDIIEPITIKELIDQDYLARLKSKRTGHKLNVDNVKKRGGEYIESMLQEAVNTYESNVAVVEEVINRAESRKAWLFFCTGVDHASEMKELLIDRGIVAEVITGKTSKKERERILEDFKAGKIQALTNANVLTTGFDYPDIDLIALVRPTMSPALYVQMVGRGMRLKSHTDHCLVLDFAGNITRHGPIVNVREPKKNTKKEKGEAPTKDCPECNEILHASVKKCTSCGFEFIGEEKRYSIDNTACIMGETDSYLMVTTNWFWSTHVSRSSGKEMIKVSYYGAMNQKPITEYFPVTHGGYAGKIAIDKIKLIAYKSGLDSRDVNNAKDLTELSKLMNTGNSPTYIDYTKEGNFTKVIDREWKKEDKEELEEEPEREAV